MPSEAILLLFPKLWVKHNQQHLPGQLSPSPSLTGAALIKINCQTP